MGLLERAEARRTCARIRVLQVPRLAIASRADPLGLNRAVLHGPSDTQSMQLDPLERTERIHKIMGLVQLP